MSQFTLGIIKPDAFKKRVVGKILTRIENEGFAIAGMRLHRLTMEEAKAFYIVHKQRPFYGELTEFMASGSCVLLLLERDDAIGLWRRIMGSTDPAKAEPGTLRREFGFNIERNALHGSDSAETAEWEIAFFFKK
ncbi:MAG: nucleoside-diphosphate kinase [Candidatus Aminicenantes bacterium]|nr:nucleoside-diphosphate kinase [Candidatus Aminicenantes bacterium]